MSRTGRERATKRATAGSAVRSRQRTPPLLAIVGGMLGAGKTTLILEAAKRLGARGLRAAMITNDQGSELIDTQLARAAGVPIGEVAGGYFCCRLSDLLDATDALQALDPDVVFAEPVGSCTDLAATVLRPILRDEAHRFRIAPLTVLVDPVRAQSLTAADADPDLAFLFHQQLVEADIVCATKADEARAGRKSRPYASRRRTASAMRTRPSLRRVGTSLPTWELAVDVPAHRVSARTGEGVDAWLDHVLGSRIAAGALPIVDLDYTRYAAAEATLAWLNWHAQVELETAAPPAMVAGALADALEGELPREGLAIAHVKVLDQAVSGYVRVSLCGDGRPPTVDGALGASPTRTHQLLINARVLGDPEALSRIVGQCLRSLAGELRSIHREAFRPAPPKPERRVI
jgi:hypothetical protein